LKRVKVGITRGEIDLGRIIEELKPLGREGYGAIVAFVGMVKGIVDGVGVDELRYEAYEELAEKMLAKIAEDETMKHGLGAVIIYHRVGDLKPGEATVYIVVAARGRKEGFQAAAEILDRVKHEAPIYKLEVREDGEFWVIGDGERVPRPSNQRGP
jgi:molybdopterin synthase catalytic subunit